jgi:transposase InsO family protein
MHASKLVAGAGKRFESARRLSKSANLQVKRGRRSERRDAYRLRVLQPVVQPVWTKPSPHDVLEVQLP